MLSVKPAFSEDIPLIRALTFKVWPQTYAALLSAQQIDYMLQLMYSEASLQQQMSEGVQFITVHDQGQAVGFAAYQQLENKVWKLHKIYVLPGQQGKGTGTFIIHHIISAIKMQDAVALQLQVKRDNPAQDFYKKLGFEILYEADFDIGNGYLMSDYVMQKNL